LSKPSRKKVHPVVARQLAQKPPTETMQPVQNLDATKLDPLPSSYQEINDFYLQWPDVKPFDVRQETFKRIEKITGRPLICYVSKTRNVPQGVPSYIDDSDLTGFGDLIYSVEGDAVDVLIISNGGSAEATERIVRLLRERFNQIRFILPSNAYSAATLLAFSGEEVIMGPQATLGPIDPQLNGIPARAILRAFETLKSLLESEGPSALTAYMPLVMKYDLHILEMCRSMEALSKELARSWLSTYMLKCDPGAPELDAIINFFSDYDLHKSHGRSIERHRARELGLKVVYTEEMEGLEPLIRGLANQYELWFDRTPFFKDFENAHGINWGRQSQSVTLQIPIGQPIMPQPVPQPGPPERSG